jgi:hypothetical protein
MERISFSRTLMPASPSFSDCGDGEKLWLADAVHADYRCAEMISDSFLCNAFSAGPALGIPA